MPPRRMIPFGTQPTPAGFGRRVYGYWPNQDKLPGIPGSVIAGKNMFQRGAGKWEASKGIGSGGSNGGVRHLQTVGGTHGGMSILGSVIRFFNSNVWAGSGNAFEGGVNLGAAGASLVIKPIGGAAKAVGELAPAAPVISAGPAGLLDGTESIRLTAVSDLGEESNASAPSNIISLTLGKVHFTTPPLPSGATKFGVYCPRQGFGREGPHFRQTLLGDIPPGTYDIDWTDSILGQIAPIANNPPPPCTFAGSLNNILVAIGAYGDMIAPSAAGDFGAFSPDWPVSMNGAPTGVKAGMDDSLVISTATSVIGCRASGDVEVTPIAIWLIWERMGFSNMSAWCVHGSDIWGYNGRGPVTSAFGADHESDFAQPVMSDFISFGLNGSNTTVNHDPQSKGMVIASGINAWVYGLQTGEWSTRMELPATIVTSEVAGDTLLLGAADGSMYVLDAGTGIAYELMWCWENVGEPEMDGNIIFASADITNACNIDIYTDLDEGTSRFTGSLNPNHSGWKPVGGDALLKAKSVTVKLSGSGTQVIRRAQVLAVPHKVAKVA
jgi:hypothetical protein